MSTPQREAFDLVLAGGEVLDGTGAPRRAADVGVREGRIAAVGDLARAPARRRLEVRGRILAPGFIDVHTHDDRALLSTPQMTMKVSQGVTTVIAGNCGISLAPLVCANPPPPLDLIGDEDGYRFGSMAAYLDELEDAPPSVNAAFLVGHSTLRAAGMDRLDRAATAAETARMRRLLEESLVAGAIGLSTGLHYAPAAAAPTEEVIELARTLAGHGARYVTHLRDEGDRVLEALEECFTIGREAAIPVVVSHHKVNGKQNFGRATQTLGCFERHMPHQDIGLDAYPYAASSTVLQAGSIALAEKVLITWSGPHPEYAGRDLAGIAAELGCDLYQAADRLQPAGAIYFSMDERDVQRILAFPHTMIGSDGLPHDAHPHPRLWGTFARVLGRYCRDLGLWPLEEAVRRMTSLPAHKFGLHDRGRIAVGCHADLCIFDPVRVGDRATFAQPALPAAGIAHVFVNGCEVWHDGMHTGARPGRVLRQGRAGPGPAA